MKAIDIYWRNGWVEGGWGS